MFQALHKGAKKAAKSSKTPKRLKKGAAKAVISLEKKMRNMSCPIRR